jgi:hypothetical protein
VSIPLFLFDHYRSDRVRQTFANRRLAFPDQVVGQGPIRRIHDDDNDTAVFVQKTRRL